jgi:hypothetical protein
MNGHCLTAAILRRDIPAYNFGFAFEDDQVLVRASCSRRVIYEVG